MNKTTGLEALLSSSKTMKLATSTRQSNPAWKQGIVLMQKVGADKAPKTLEVIARQSTIDNAIKVFGSTDKFDTTDTEKMEQFTKLDARSQKILGTIKGSGKSNITNNSKEFDVKEIAGTFQLIAKVVVEE